LKDRNIDILAFVIFYFTRFCALCLKNYLHLAIEILLAQSQSFYGVRSGILEIWKIGNIYFTLTLNAPLLTPGNIYFTLTLNAPVYLNIIS
jgi:hypothetical protein